MRFDLRNVEGTKKFLHDWVGVDEISIISYIIDNSEDIDIDDFCERYNISLDDLEIDNITYVASHVTTCLDGLETIKKYGIMDLTSVLSYPTPLNIFLQNHGIEFDIDKRIMKVGNKSYDVSYNTNSNKSFLDRRSLEGRLNSIGHKLYYDNQLSAFLTMEGDKEYGGNVHLRPEFLLNVSSICKLNLENEWAKRAKAYVLEFEEKFENFEWFTFYNTKEDYNEDVSKMIEHRRWLLSKSLYRLQNYISYNQRIEDFAYMKPSYIVPWKNIIGIREIV
ncbi:hypothetical protein [Senegalia massiliensis]|uniref:Uncharacterized protein n=1 Tax=Senegalia massiliensis TaxID=1720316 RepID=A0A845QX74_9CLOT|nr:hypothetical protein [Senegalia massiliensis]NBI05752.1 hypothetical protein [Senegalia massiliensis]